MAYGDIGSASSTMPYTLSPPAARHKPVAILFSQRRSEEGRHLSLTSYCPALAFAAERMN